MSYFSITVEPRFNEPLFNEVLDITNDILCSSQSYSKMYGIEPRYNKFFDITHIFRKPKRKIYLDITNYHVDTRQKINAGQINRQHILKILMLKSGAKEQKFLRSPSSMEDTFFSEDASQKKEAIYIERILSLNINCCWFLFSSIYHFLFKFSYGQNATRVSRNWRNSWLSLICSYVWTVNVFGKGTDIEANTLNLWNPEMLGSAT